MHVERIAISRGHLSRFASRVIAGVALAATGLAAAAPAVATTLERIKETGHIRLGYVDNARPFSFKGDAGAADGYAIALCISVVDQVKKDLGLSQLTVDFVPVGVDRRMSELDSAQIDLLCYPTSVTLARRKEASFSIPVFAGGNRAVMMRDAAVKLRATIEADTQAQKAQPVWRGSPASRVLKGTRFAVVSDTATQRWLETQRRKLGVDATTEPVPDYQTGLRLLQEGKVDVFFGDRALVLGAMDATSRKNLVILDREFTHDPYALALARGDEDFRLVVDRALSQVYAMPEFGKLYEMWFGAFDDKTRTFFQWVTIPE